MYCIQYIINSGLQGATWTSRHPSVEGNSQVVEIQSHLAASSFFWFLVVCCLRCHNKHSVGGNSQVVEIQLHIVISSFSFSLLVCCHDEHSVEDNTIQSDMNIQWSHFQLQSLSFFCSLLLICLFSLCPLCLSLFSREKRHRGTCQASVWPPPPTAPFMLPLLPDYFVARLPQWTFSEATTPMTPSPGNLTVD